MSFAYITDFKSDNTKVMIRMVFEYIDKNGFVLFFDKHIQNMCEYLLLVLHDKDKQSCFSLGFERRPLKHPTCPDGAESHSGPARMPRRGTVPALLPKPPSYPLVKMVGKYYTLKCR